MAEVAGFYFWIFHDFGFLSYTRGMHAVGAYYTTPLGYSANPANLANLAPALSPWEASSPSMAIYRRAFGQAAAPQAGPADIAGPAAGTLLGFTALTFAGIILLAVVVNYQVGKAMAPNEAAESKWAWGNAIGGTVFPPVTLGMAVYKNYFLGD